MHLRTLTLLTTAALGANLVYEQGAAVPNPLTSAAILSGSNGQR